MIIISTFSRLLLHSDRSRDFQQDYYNRKPLHVFELCFCFFFFFFATFVLTSNIKLTLKSMEVKINIIVFMYVFSLGNLNY